MTTATATTTCDIGVIGLGTMGRNLVLNIGDHDIPVVGYNRHNDKVDLLLQEAKKPNVYGQKDLQAFVNNLKSPRVIMLMVTAGSGTDAVINEVAPLLSPGDIIIDGGNSYYPDTNRREKDLGAKGIKFLGIGVSGGEEGARHGPCMMPGGPKEAYEQVAKIFESAAAKVGGEPCVAYLGPNSAGHYVKMVHNGIEYGLMQLIAESYDLMKRGLGLSNAEMQKIYTDWNNAELGSFLIEITAEVFKQKDPDTGKELVDCIVDVARQKGTGLWTSEDAMRLNVPAPTIDMAVSLRDLSVLKEARKTASQLLKGPSTSFSGDKHAMVTQIKDALYCAMIITYAQGMSLLSVASERYGYGLDLRTVAKIWRGGCIIRATLLENMMQAYQAQPSLETLLLNKDIAGLVISRDGNFRSAICQAIQLGIPVPGFSASLGYYDALRSETLPANLIQAQRDLFGAHTYQRLDKDGNFHMQWGGTTQEAV